MKKGWKNSSLSLSWYVLRTEEIRFGAPFPNSFLPEDLHGNPERKIPTIEGLTSRYQVGCNSGVEQANPDDSGQVISQYADYLE